MPCSTSSSGHFTDERPPDADLTIRMLLRPGLILFGGLGVVCLAAGAQGPWRRAEFRWFFAARASSGYGARSRRSPATEGSPPRRARPRPGRPGPPGGAAPRSRGGRSRSRRSGSGVEVRWEVKVARHADRAVGKGNGVHGSLPVLVLVSAVAITLDRASGLINFSPPTSSTSV